MDSIPFTACADCGKETTTLVLLVRPGVFSLTPSCNFCLSNWSRDLLEPTSGIARITLPAGFVRVAKLDS